MYICIYIYIYVKTIGCHDSKVCDAEILTLKEDLLNGKGSSVMDKNHGQIASVREGLGLNDHYICNCQQCHLICLWHIQS